MTESIVEESLIKSGLRQIALYLTGIAKYSKWSIRDRIAFDPVRHYHKGVLNTFIKNSKFRLIVGAHRMCLLKILKYSRDSIHMFYSDLATANRLNFVLAA